MGFDRASVAADIAAALAGAAPLEAASVAADLALELREAAVAQDMTAYFERDSQRRTTRVAIAADGELPSLEITPSYDADGLIAAAAITRIATNA